MPADTVKKAWLYLRMSARLRCPICGISPLFLPAHRVEGLEDWYTTLPGCPRCGYPYEREPSYFLLAVGLSNFGVIMVLGMGLVFSLDFLFELSTAQLIFFTLVPTLVISILSVRHAKAFFLAFDHFLDPDDNEDDDHRPPAADESSFGGHEMRIEMTNFNVGSWCSNSVWTPNCVAILSFATSTQAK